MTVTYTTDAEVRDEAWFNNNTFIADAEIDAARVRAYGVINTKISPIYKTPLTVDGDFTGSFAETYIKNIELFLASAYLLIKEYGVESVNSDKDWYNKRQIALEMLDDVAMGDIKLIDLNGDELDKNEGTWKKIRIEWKPTTDNDQIFSVLDTY